MRFRRKVDFLFLQSVFRFIVAFPGTVKQSTLVGDYLVLIWDSEMGGLLLERGPG